MRRSPLVRLMLGFAWLLALGLPTCASASTDTDWLNAAYQAFLDRPADPGALSFFAPGGTLAFSRPTIAFAIDTSLEYQSDFVGGGPLSGVFQDFLGRNPSGADLQFFTQATQSGATDEQIEASILGSTEYLNRAGGTNLDFITQLYHDVLDRSPSALDVSFATTFLASNTRAQFADYVLTSTEYRTLLINSSFERFLCRAPDATSDAFFLNALGSGVTDEQMFAVIVGSAEFGSSSSACNGGAGGISITDRFPTSTDTPTFPTDAAFLPPALQTPEPASLALLIGGLIGAGVRRRVMR